MLKLSLNENEGLTIFTKDQEIKVTFLKRKGKQVFLSIDAPKEVKVLRDKLVERSELALSRPEEVTISYN